MAGEKILIIDPSEEDVRPLVEELLDPDGYLVIHALDGEEGLQQALTGNPDLIIAEFAAPKRPGLEILAQLREGKRDIPFILTGASSSAETFKQALRVGVVDYLIKPLDMGEARSAIARALVKKSQPMPAKETGLLSRGFELINRQLENRVRELSILHGIGKSVTSVRDLENLLNRIVEAAVYLTGAEEGFLLLVDEETSELYMRAGKGLGKKFATGFRVKSEDSLSWQVVRTAKPIMISTVSDGEQFELKTGYLVKALLHVPLTLRGQVIGVLSVDNKIARKAFDDNDLHLLSALADYAAIAIDNVQQYERAEAEAAKLAELLAAQASQPPTVPQSAPVAPVSPAAQGAPQAKAVPLDWLVQALQVQQGIAEEGLEEAEELARELASQVSALEKLTRRWQDQRAESEELVRRLASGQVVAAAGSAETLTPALTDLQGILDNMEEGLILADHQGSVTLTNRAAAHLLGSEQLLGRDLRLVSTAPHWVKCVDRLRDESAHDKSVWQEATFWNNGRLIKANFVPLSHDQGGGWAVILRDLGREHVIQLAREELSSAISQELRTPMTVLTSYTDLLLAETVGLLVPLQRRLLERMRDNLTRMSSTLNNLMSVSPVAMGKKKESFSAVDLNRVIKEALADASTWFKERGLRLQLNLAENLPRAMAEPDCVYQMVVNLLQNAVRATPAGGIVTVQAEVGQSDGVKDSSPHVVISVQDQGGGIPPEFLSQVFEHFYSDEEQPIPGLGGKGAELSLVKMLVGIFGGRVWVETEPGVGSTFSFVLPTVQG